MSFGNLQKMAAQMQRDMARVEEELHAARLEGSAGGGVVRAVVSGKQELVELHLDPDAVDPADVEMLQDLVVAAVNDAIRARGTSRSRRWLPSPAASACRGCRRAALRIRRMATP